MFCSKKKKLHIFLGDEAAHILMFVVCLVMFFIGVFSHEVLLSGGKSRLGPGSKSFPVPKKKTWW